MILVPFSFSESLLKNGITSLTATECQRFIYILKERGIICYDGNDFTKSTELAYLIKNKFLKFFLKRIFNENYSGIRTKSIQKSPVKLCDYNNFKDLEKDYNEVKCVLVEDKFSHTNFKITPPLLTLESDNIEISLLKGFDFTRCYNAAKNLSQLGIFRGKDRIKIWDERFSQLADYSNEVVIMDRYCLAASHNLKSLEFILDKLCKSNTPINKLYIFAAYGQEYTIKSESTSKTALRTKGEIENNFSVIQSSLEKKYKDLGSIKQIDLNLVDDILFKGVSHDRFIAFDEAVIEIGTGCMLFSEPITMVRSTFTVKKFDTFHSVAIEKLRSKAEEKGDASTPHNAHPE